MNDDLLDVLADTDYAKANGLDVMANADCTGGLNGTFLVRPRDGRGPRLPSAPAGQVESGSPPSGDRRFLFRPILQSKDSIYQNYQNGEQGSVSLSVRPEMMHDEANLLPFHFLRSGDRIGRAVVKIQRDDGSTGTGFLVASDIVLTNHHVLPDPETASGAVALANYEVNPPDDPSGRPTVAPLDPHSLFVTNTDLDFTFCGVRGLDFLGAVQLDREQMHVSPDEIVNIIQHPRGRPKEVVLRDNWVVRADSVVLHYSCDTEPGSSGSPVFNNAWKPVAIHHASVLTDSAEGRTISGEDSGRYINEGIRLSAIALWLETAEANSQGRRDQVARLRALFGGLNAQVGFFGALGRRSQGRTAPEVVADSYRGESDSLDVGYWNTHTLGGIPRDRLAEVAQVIADMGLDIWCLTHADPSTVDALCQILRAGHRLDFESVFTGVDTRTSPVFMFRRLKDIGVERIEPELRLIPVVPPTHIHDPAMEAAVFFEPEAQAEPPPSTISALPPVRIRVCVGRKKGGPIEFRFAVVHRRSEFEALRAEHAGCDWLLFGDTATLLSPESHALLDPNQTKLVAAGGEQAEGAMVWLPSETTSVDLLFTTPNLHPTLGPPEMVMPARDRAMPTSLRNLPGSRPIAVRLTLGEPPSQEPVEFVPEPEPPPDLAEDPLEQRLRQALEPLLSKLLAELRSKL